MSASLRSRPNLRTAAIRRGVPIADSHAVQQTPSAVAMPLFDQLIGCGEQRNFPIHKLFERSCELGLWRLTAHKISEIFGQRLHRKMSGKLATVIDQPRAAAR